MPPCPGLHLFSMTCLDDSSLPFLHGTLVIRVEEARDLPDLDRLVIVLKCFCIKHLILQFLVA